MKNEQEMLELFKVEELEKRYEMGRWSISGSVSYGSEGASGTIGGSYTFNYSIHVQTARKTLAVFSN